MWLLRKVIVEFSLSKFQEHIWLIFFFFLHSCESTGIVVRCCPICLTDSFNMQCHNNNSNNLCVCWGRLASWVPLELWKKPGRKTSSRYETTIIMWARLICARPLTRCYHHRAWLTVYDAVLHVAFIHTFLSHYHTNILWFENVVSGFSYSSEKLSFS